MNKLFDFDFDFDIDFENQKQKKSKKMDQYITNNNRPTNLFCTANIVENLFIVTNNNKILTLEPLN